MELEVKNIKCGYKNKVILKDISFLAKNGEVTVILGSNGAGKSTLIKAILGIIKSQGEILFDGKNKNTFSIKKLNESIGYMPQENSVNVSLLNLDVVLLGKISSLSLKVKQKDIDLAYEIMKKLEIDHLALVPYNEQSGGQRRVINIAQTIIKEPKILILDEPCANLDIKNSLEVLNLLREYAKYKNIPMVLTLHDLNLASRFADKIVFLNQGYVYKFGTAKEVFTEDSIRETYGVNVHILKDNPDFPTISLVSSVHEKNYFK